jgi:3-hydroxybutyryl-CoA dehydratase
MSVQSVIGKSTSFRKTVSESDIYMFAGITGDFSPNHVDDVFMQGTPYGRRIAHGALLVGYMSGSSTDIVTNCPELSNFQPVSLGYDRIRFLKAVFIGDTIEMRYVITACDVAKSRTMANVTVTNQAGDLCCVATHIMSWLEKAVRVVI